MKKFKRSLLWGGMFLALILIGFAAYGLVQSSRSPVPANIKSQVGFVVYYPESEQFKITGKSFSYDSSIKQLKFDVTAGRAKIIISEQATPETFTDIPEYYDKLMQKMNGYASFDTANGKVTLTRPTEVKNQVGVLNNKGTLVFARSDHDLSKEDWRRLFNSLKTIQPQ